MIYLIYRYRYIYLNIIYICIYLSLYIYVRLFIYICIYPLYVYLSIYIYVYVGTPKSSILTRFSIINHPFWGTPIFGNIHMEHMGSDLLGKLGVSVVATPCCLAAARLQTSGCLCPCLRDILSSASASLGNMGTFLVFFNVFWLVVSNIFYFHPYLGKWSNLTKIVQMGWNHQLANYWIEGLANL